MKSLINIGVYAVIMGLMVACGSQIVEFPDDGTQNDSGNSDNTNPSDSGLSQLNDAGNVSNDSGFVNDSGSPVNNDAGDSSDGGKGSCPNHHHGSCTHDLCW